MASPTPPAGGAADGRPVDAATADDLNARFWDALADRHARGTGRFYDTEALVRGESPLWASEAAALARVAPDGLAGRRVLHLQCHLASDAIHFARLGAEVTALDRSSAALRHAAERAARCGVELRFVEADASDPPAELDGRFDLIWATIGVTCWIPDLDRWMAGAKRLLRPGGRLVLIDLHPLFSMLETFAPVRADFPYGGGALLAFDDGGGDYNGDVDAAPGGATANAAWSVGEHVSAAVRSGLVVDHLEEHLETDRCPVGGLTPEADGLYRLRYGPDQPPLPVLFTLVAHRP